MIVGNGLLANSFRNHYEDSKGTILFASGVSNSTEESTEVYRRELELLMSQDKTKKLVYFSTVSIFDKSLEDSSYIIHKHFIENYIKTYFSKYCIFRLPIVVSDSSNPNTFFNAIKTKIESNETIEVYKNATRYLIDVDDIVSILPKIIRKESKLVMNVCFSNQKLVLDLVRLMTILLNKSSNMKVIDKGYSYEVDNKDFLSRLPYGVSENYTLNLLIKYLTR